ncbi:MAG: hypothetical protein IPN60_09500 [Saprospiraceae bacterium]|nr:hypothetical protein [Candidatus Opimibacter skivensis]
MHINMLKIKEEKQADPSTFILIVDGKDDRIFIIPYRKDVHPMSRARWARHIA